MATFVFEDASKSEGRLRLAIDGPSGSGKTFTALRVASALGNKVAVIDTERGSASKYADKFKFARVNLTNFHPQNYIDAIHAAEQAGFDVLVIDSLSHAWFGKDGALELVDRAAAAAQSQNTYTAWRKVTPLHNALVDTILQSPLHIIATMRTKTEYVLETNERGKQTPRKVGMAPIQRDGMEYEFDVVGDMDHDHNFIVSKTRCDLLDGAVINKPGENLSATLKAWLSDGTPYVAPTPPETPAPTTPADAPKSTPAASEPSPEKKHADRDGSAMYRRMANKGFPEGVVKAHMRKEWQAQHVDDLPDDAWVILWDKSLRGTKDGLALFFGVDPVSKGA